MSVWPRGSRIQARTASKPVLLLLAAAGLLLLIACVNVALLQLGEVGARRREITVRVALGAGQGRLVRQLLGESLVLSCTAGVLGSALAWAMLKALLAIAPERLPGLDAVQIDGRVLLFALLVAIATGLAFGIVPAWLVGRGGPAGAVRAGTGQSARGAALLQRSLLAAQIAMSMVMLVMSVLLEQSLKQLSNVDPGFRPESLTAVYVRPCRGTTQENACGSCSCRRAVGLPTFPVFAMSPSAAQHRLSGIQ